MRDSRLNLSEMALNADARCHQMIATEQINEPPRTETPLPSKLNKSAGKIKGQSIFKLALPMSCDLGYQTESYAESKQKRGGV